MDIERLKHRLNGFTSKKDVNDDTYLNINLNTRERLLPSDEKNKTVNVSDRFDTERNRSSYFRIIGSLNPTVSNALFNLNDNVKSNAFTWSTFNDISFLDTSYPKDFDVFDKTDYTYPLSIKNNLVEMDGWFGHFNPVKTSFGFCEFFDMEPKRERFSFIPDIAPFHPTPAQVADNTTQVKNWELTITYPASADTQHYMVNSPLTGNGLLIVDKSSTSVATRPMTGFGLACKHNLKIGDIVKITGTTGFNGQHIVIRTGLDNGDLKDNYFVLDLPNTGSITPNSRMVKVVNGIESKYYFRKFKKIKTKNTPVIETDDYETYALGFSENIYSDKIVQYVFNEDIDISDLTDNMGRPLSEIFLSIIKTDSNNLFSKVSSGLETPFFENFNNSGGAYGHLKGLPIINKIHNGVLSQLGAPLPFDSYTPLESNVLISDTLFYGDLVEFNANDLLEVVLADVHHRFNTLNRESPVNLAAVNTIQTTTSLVTDNIVLGPRQEGYHYKAHNKIVIRDFSSYIETGDLATEGIPSYAINLGDGRFVWRDLLDLGFSEVNLKSLDYPFLNGSHYLYNNFNFYLKRQDPFNIWDLFYSNYPPDPIGEKINNNFITNSEEDVC
tara:strand:- start:493 stop:2328 length:1836 start_codon:yes stop_codon:yes gene_type:complete